MNEMQLSFFTSDSTFPFFIQYGGHDESMFMHVHTDFSEMVLVLEGSAVHAVNSEEYFVCKGDVFVINKGTAHGYKNTENFRICNIMFHPEMLSGGDLTQSAGYHALFVIEPYLAGEQRFESRLKLGAEDFSRAKLLIADMIDEYNSKRDGRKTLLSAYFTELVTMLARKYALPSEKDKAEINLAKAVSYMENNYNAGISIKELAEMCYISDRHFSRIFRATYRLTPGAYLNEIRMKNASMMLKSTDLTVTDISERCGFSDSSFFARQFRKTFGISPIEYRKNG